MSARIMTTSEYRFVCVDEHGVWQAVTYELLADDNTAKARAVHLADHCAYVLIWNQSQPMGLVASLGRRTEFLPTA